MAARNENILHDEASCHDTLEATPHQSLTDMNNRSDSVEMWIMKEKDAWEDSIRDTASPMTLADPSIAPDPADILDCEKMRETSTVLDVSGSNDCDQIKVDFCENDTESVGCEAYPQQTYSEFLSDSISLWPYGRVNTIIAIAITLSAFVLTVMARSDVSYVSLQKALAVKEESFGPLKDVGLLFVKLCEVHLSEEQSMSRGKTPYKIVGPSLFEIENLDLTSSECHVERWRRGAVKDSLWDLSRVASTLSLWLGGIVLVSLILGIFLERLNIRAIALTSVGAFWFQAMTFVIYGSEMCYNHQCSLSSGSNYSASASVLWFVGAVAIFRLYMHQCEENFYLMEQCDISTDKDACKLDSSQKSKKKQFERPERRDTLNDTMTTIQTILFEDSRSVTTATTEDHNERDQSIDVLMAHHVKHNSRSYALDLILETDESTTSSQLPSPQSDECNL